MNKTIIRSTPQGEIKGVEKPGYQYFIGIPFAAANKRFSKPEPVKSWDGVFDGTQKPTQPVQIPLPMVSGKTKTSEDCLYLNVYTPSSSAKKKAVMVWFYGGGFSQGAAFSRLYDGQFLAKRGDVVVVTVNYRVGHFGYANFEHIEQNYIDTKPNLGLHDQLEALKWVNKNIEAYGGDPDKVTIFGQSAGALSVASLVCSPQAKGLFRRAISQSGGDVLISSEKVSQNLTDSKLEELQVNKSNIHKLEDLPARKMITLKMQHVNYGTELLPEKPLDAIKNGNANNIDFMIGYTREEVALPLFIKRLGYIGKLLKIMVKRQGFSGSYESLPYAPLLSSPVKDNMKEIVHYYEAYFKKSYNRFTEEDVCCAILSDAIFTVPSRRYLNAYSTSSTAGNTYAYRFDWGARLFNSSSPISFHAVDVPFSFGTTRTLNRSLRLFAGANESADRLSDQMVDAWAAFARNGDPNHESLPEWKKYSKDEPNYMLFDTVSETTDNERNEVFSFWDQLLGEDTATTFG